jgi:predicted O-linked N-acetylglucosamine transferase (SPINDLY family)
MGLFGRFRLPLWKNTCETDDRAADILALIQQGNDFEDAHLLEQAMGCYEAAIRAAPRLARAHLSRGNILLALGDTQAALAAYETALACNPRYAAAHFGKGNVFIRMDNTDAALASFSIAIELQPDFTDAHVSLGCVLESVEDFAGAQASYERALELQPKYAEVHSNLGNVLAAMGRFEDAVVSFLKALELKPGFAEAHNNLGNAFKGMGRFNDAIACYQRAAIQKPEFADAYCNLGGAYMGLGQPENAEAYYRQALEIKPDHAESLAKLLFSHNYRIAKSPSIPLLDAKRFGQVASNRANVYREWPNAPDASRCLRVGFVSGDFRQHPVGNFLDAALKSLASETAARLEIFAYSNCSDIDDVTERIKASCHGWRNVAGVTDEKLAKLIRNDGIDILIDLAGHTRYSRLLMFAWRPAPVQISWLGYLATTGVAEIDYVLGDAWTLPETDACCFTERIWRLPDTYLCYTPPIMSTDVGALPALDNSFITFGCFNNVNKMNDAVVAVWSQILKAVPNSRLFLKSQQFANESDRQSVTMRYAHHGVESDRLILEGQVAREQYLAPFRRVDISLDPFPYPGITTTVDSLWMGVPVLTLAGGSFLARQGVGLLMNARLVLWIAADTNDYIARAVEHASNLQRLASLRQVLRQQVLASPIFDSKRFALRFETALRSMWQEWCKNQNLAVATPLR